MSKQILLLLRFSLLLSIFNFASIMHVNAAATSTGNVNTNINGAGPFNLGSNEIIVGGFGSGLPGLIEADAVSITASNIILGGPNSLQPPTTYGGKDGFGSMILSNSSIVSLTSMGELGRNFDIGSDGMGFMRVLSGSSIDATFTGVTCTTFTCTTYISNGAGSSGELEVLGSGTIVNTRDLVVANASVFTLADDGFDFGILGGTSFGSILISDSGTVNSVNSILGGLGVGLPSGNTLESAFASARVTMNGVWNSDSFSIGTNDKAKGTLTVDHNGLVDTATFVSIANGQVSIESGGEMQQNQFILGNSLGLSAFNAHTQVQVTGTNSELNFTGNDSFLSVGLSGYGQFQLLDGASVNDAIFLSVGFFTEGSGSVVIDGTGTQLNLSGVCTDCASVSAATGTGASFNIGFGGKGDVVVSNGANVSVDGTGSTTNRGVYVGLSGTSALGGATVPGNGSLEVKGTTTSIQVVGELSRFEVGTFGGTGNAAIKDGAQITLDNTDGNGTSRLGSENGDGTLLISGSNSLLNAGNAFIAGNEDNSVGGLAYLTVENGGELQASLITLNAGAMLSGNGGTLTGTVVNNNGTLLAGSSPGVLNINGDLMLEGGKLLVSVAGPTQSDISVLNVSNDVDLNTGEIIVSFINGFIPSADFMVDFVTSNTGNINLSENVNITFSGLPNGFNFDIGVNGSSLTLSNTPISFSVPVPIWTLVIFASILILISNLFSSSRR